MEEFRDTIDNIKDAETAINQDPPAAGSKRQQYFMERAKRQLTELSCRLGCPLTCCVNTLRCQMNARDSEKLLGILETISCQAVESEKADFVFFNACIVRENTSLRAYGRLEQLGVYKKTHPDVMIALRGYMMQEEEAVEEIGKGYRYVDLVFGTHNIFKLAEPVSLCLKRRIQDGQKQGKTKMVVDAWKDMDQIVEDLLVGRELPFKSGVNTMFGCNNFCSYCIVSYVGGRERSRRPEEIIKEIQKLAADGVVEIMFLGQNVNSYGKNLDNPMTSAQPLEGVEKIDGIGRIRFMISHPKDLSDELIEAAARSEKICHHLHLPLQSGSSRILKVMNRRYTREQYLDLAEWIKKAVPGISLTADIIVGFPGETDEDFEETMDVVRKVGFDSAFTFIYSKRTGTSAVAMEDQVPEAIVKERSDRFLKKAQDISVEVCGRDVRTVREILVEEVNDHASGLMTGRLSNNTVVHFPGDVSMIGRLAPVYLQESKGFYYMGHIADEENEQNQTNNNQQIKIKQE